MSKVSTSKITSEVINVDTTGIKPEAKNTIKKSVLEQK